MPASWPARWMSACSSEAKAVLNRPLKLVAFAVDNAEPSGGDRLTARVAAWQACHRRM